jgi:phosphotransferase system HPr (HPr) family protein
MSEPLAVKITPKGGLAPKLSALLAMAAVKFKSNASVSFNGRTANAKAMTELMSLCAEQGSFVHLRAQGEDAEQLLNVLLAVIQKK